MSTKGSAQLSPVYLVWTQDLVIEAAPAAVWPHVLDYPKWQQFAITERISGEANTAGEIVLLKKIEAGFDFPPYYARTILLELNRRIIWKTYHHESAPMGFVGFVDFTLKPEEARTRFTYNIIYEFLLDNSDSAEREAFRREQQAASQRVFDSIFPKLKRLVETGSL